VRTSRALFLSFSLARSFPLSHTRILFLLDVDNYRAPREMDVCRAVPRYLSRPPA